MDLSSTVQQAKQDREKILQRITELNEELKAIEGFISYSEKYLGIVENGNLGSGLDIMIKNKISMPEAARRVLKGNKRPMHISEILDEIEKAGLFKDKDHRTIYQNVYSGLKKQKSFKKIEGKEAVFGLTEWFKK